MTLFPLKKLFIHCALVFPFVCTNAVADTYPSNFYNQQTHKTSTSSDKLLSPYFAALNLKSGITFPSENEEFKVIIFWDKMCSWCQYLAKSIPDMQQKGISVTVLPYSRNGFDTVSNKEMMDMWSHEQPLKYYVESRSLPHTVKSAEATQADFIDTYNLAKNLDIDSTPTILLLINGQTEAIRGAISANSLYDYLIKNAVNYSI